MRSALATKPPDDEEPEDGAAGTGWLIARARNGDRAAFARLVEAHYDFIFRTACKWCGKRSDAEDIAQEVCIKLAAALEDFRRPLGVHQLALPRDAQRRPRLPARRTPAAAATSTP